MQVASTTIKLQHKVLNISTAILSPLTCYLVCSGIPNKYKTESIFATHFHANNLKSHRESGVLDFHFKKDGVDGVLPLPLAKFN